MGCVGNAIIISLYLLSVDVRNCAITDIFIYWITDIFIYWITDIFYIFFLYLLRLYQLLIFFTFCFYICCVCINYWYFLYLFLYLINLLCSVLTRVRSFSVVHWWPRPQYVKYISLLCHIVIEFGLWFVGVSNTRL